MKFADQDFAGFLVFQAAEKLPHHAEAGGNHAAAISRVDSLFQQLHGQISHHQAAQGVGAPQLIVVAAARVEADDEAGDSDAARKRSM